MKLAAFLLVLLYLALVLRLLRDQIFRECERGPDREAEPDFV